MERRMRPVLVGSGFASGASGAVSAQCDLRPNDDQSQTGHRRDGEVLSQKNITARAPGTWRSAVMIATGNANTEPTASEKRLVVLAGTPRSLEDQTERVKATGVAELRAFAVKLLSGTPS